MFVLANQGNKEAQANLDSLLNNFKTANAGVTKDQIGNTIATWLAEDQEASKYIEVSGAAARAQFEANKANLSYGASLVTGTSSSNPDVANLQRKIAQQIATDKKIKITEVAKLLTELSKTDKVDNDNLVDLLQYYELVKEIQVANGKLQI